MKIYSGSFLVFPREKNRVFMIISRERDTSHIFDVGLPRPLRATRWSDWSAPESTGDSWAWWKHVHGQEIRPLAGEDPDGSLQLRYRVEPWQSSRG